MLLLILLAFPALEIVLLFELASRFSWFLLGYLMLAAMAGWLLIMDERMVVFARMVQTLEQGRHPLLALLASARKIIAGVLLIIPGVASDVIGVLLLLSSLAAPVRKSMARDEVIEGEWRRED
jgi:UPF0716 protein FxsA